MEIACLFLVGDGGPERHRGVGGRRAPHQEQHRDEGQDDGERLPAIVPVESPERGPDPVGRAAPHGQSLGAARMTLDMVSPLAPSSVIVTTMV